jgi:hypothetical protein
VTAAEFRRLALAFPDTIESRHQGHPDFRTSGRIFATLGYPDEGAGMVKLPRAEQLRLLKEPPPAFEAAPGAWGDRGSTLVKLAKITAGRLRPAMELAWRHAKPVPRRSNRA